MKSSFYALGSYGKPQEKQTSPQKGKNSSRLNSKVKCQAKEVA